MNIEWHRLFGMALVSLFEDSPMDVIVEMDMSIKLQLLDVVILRRRPGDLTIALPDGFDCLGDHNLLTYKSHQESLTDWLINELIGHAVNYRKQSGSNESQWIPRSDIRLFAVTTRFPQQLHQQVGLKPLERGAGAYDLQWGTNRIRVIVLSELDMTGHNAMLNLFSHSRDKVEFGRNNVANTQQPVSAIFNRVLELYSLEGLQMPYTMADFMRDIARSHLHELSADELLGRLTIDDRLKGLSPDDRLKDLTDDELEKLLEKRRSKAQQN